MTVSDATETFTQSPPILPGACRLGGMIRVGLTAVFAGGVQRLAVSPDGSTVVFEKTNRFSIIGAPPLPPEREGFFVVRADGSGLRRLGPASRESITRFVLDPSAPSGFRGLFDEDPISFSADGRQIVFTDRRPGLTGEDAAQIMIMDLADPEKPRQVTYLPPCRVCDPVKFETWGPRFLSDGRIFFFTLVNVNGYNPEEDTRRGIATVDPKDGTVELAAPLDIGSGILIPNFAITGDRPTSFDAPFSAAAGGCEVDFRHEIFLVDHGNLLQLTNFCRSDTQAGTQSTDGERTFFRASANPPELGDSNPFENCQIFSIDRLGTNLRQLTPFNPREHSPFGCFPGGPPGCAIQRVRQDPASQALVFESSCDPFDAPFDKNPAGAQVFSMNPDGTNLRQLTAMRGLTMEADGTVDVELPGPHASTAVRQ